MFCPVPNLINGGKGPQRAEAAARGNKGIPLEAQSPALPSDTDPLRGFLCSTLSLNISVCMLGLLEYSLTLQRA